jgi:hypothetical protein
MLAEKILPEHAALFVPQLTASPLMYRKKHFHFVFNGKEVIPIETTIHAPAVENKSKLRK